MGLLVGAHLGIALLQQIQLALLVRREAQVDGSGLGRILDSLCAGVRPGREPADS